MSDKPRVYQGVRVKTTVKELLQRHRAREANNKKVKTISQACLELQELCASTFPCRFVDPPTPAPPAVDARTLQLGAASIPFPESSCSIQMQDSVFKDLQQQYGERLLPGGGYCSGGSSVEGGGGDGCNASLSPPAALPLPWCHGLSSDADYYGHEMVACSSPESLKLCNLVDPNSYSPQDSFSSSSSSCYDSPPRMELNYGGFSSEHFHYQHCNLQDSYCPSHCWPPQQESFSAPEYAPYYPPTDYSYPCPVEENCLKRDLEMSSEMCYNVL